MSRTHDHYAARRWRNLRTVRVRAAGRNRAMGRNPTVQDLATRLHWKRARKGYKAARLEGRKVKP